MNGLFGRAVVARVSCACFALTAAAACAAAGTQTDSAGFVRTPAWDISDSTVACAASADKAKPVFGGRMWWETALASYPRPVQAAATEASSSSESGVESTERVLISNVPGIEQALPEATELADARPAGRHFVGLADPTWRELDGRSSLERRLLRLRSSSAVVVDQEEGRLLYAKNPDSVMSIASITKLMTAMVVIDSGAPLDATLTIEYADVDTLKGSSSRLRVGTRLTRSEMLKLMLMSSENRAAAALARSHPQGRQAFVDAMNEKARALGMDDTRFLDPTGLNPKNRSTAYDLALMVNAGYQYPLIRNYSTSIEHSVELPGRYRRELEFHNTNGLVASRRWDIGLSKTGYISEAGRCLVLQATIAAKPVIIVLLDSFGQFSRIADANRIKRWIEGLESAPASTRRM
ncbi:MAG TPA: D-alanyl-D-alanine endopeptidase [Burkholderiales bacterium]|nr:D-alanyl-D-alanine endopeptidase [Burkholderiales bacterium]